MLADISNFGLAGLLAAEVLFFAVVASFVKRSEMPLSCMSGGRRI